MRLTVVLGNEETERKVIVLKQHLHVLWPRGARMLRDMLELTRGEPIKYLLC